MRQITILTCNMKKFLFSVIALISVFLMSFGQSDNGYSLVVEHPDGSTQFQLSVHPVISYSGDDLIINVPDGTFSYLRSEVKRIYFTQETNSAATVKSDLKVSLIGDMLSISGIENAEDVKVYDLTGRRVNVKATVEPGTILINFTQMPKDTYIISIINHQSLKISLK